MKNVGRYPDNDTSVAIRKLSDDRLAEVSMTTQQIQDQLAGRVGSYLTPAAVDSSAAGKLTKSALAADANSYIATSELGASNGYATLVNGKIPAAQLPTAASYPRISYLEPKSSSRLINVMNTSSSYGTQAVACGSFTLQNPGYAWIPMFFGSIELQILSGAAGIATYIDVKDANGGLVAGGIAIRRGVSITRCNIYPQGIQTIYTSPSETFTFWLSMTSAGQVRSTSWEDSIHPRQVPWTNP